MYSYSAVLKEIYDGDTITIDIDLGFGIWMTQQKIRLAGINAPEMKGIESFEGKIARDILKEWIPIGTKITINTVKNKQEKYGRWLAYIIYNGENINQKLIDGGYAKPFMI